MHIKVKKLHKAYGKQVVFDNMSFSVEEGHRIGLTGINGAGKSTLLKILAGIEEIDGGTISHTKGLRIGYMPQDTSIISNESIEEYALRISGLEDTGNQLEIMLAGFGLDEISTDRSVAELSSGQKSKIFMIGVLLSNPDIFLLDEPTNNLDLPALLWLESFIARKVNTCIIVSHDRFFLDRIVNKVFEIDWSTKKLTMNAGTYSEYLERKKKSIEHQKQLFETQQEEISRLSKTAQEKERRARKESGFRKVDNDKMILGSKREQSQKSGKNARILRDKIDRMETVERPVERDLFRIEFPELSMGKRTKEITLDDVVAGYKEAFSLDPISLSIPFGTHIAILGLNGSGKSTLLKTISGEIKPLQGVVDISKDFIIGNLTQEHNNLSHNLSIKDFLSEKTDLDDTGVFYLASQFGFSADRASKKIGLLSPGERARLLFALFSSLEVNTLLLDEPTNHLDIEAQQALEEMLSCYTGTVILISHDRHLLEKFNAAQIYKLSEGHLSKCEDFTEYIETAQQKAKRLVRLI